MSIDLHIHSTISDGTMSPAELVRFAHRKGLTAIAITDHDAVDGVEEAVLVGDTLGLEVVPGIELSVRYLSGTVHMLGYLFDYKREELHLALRSLQDGRIERNIKIINKLCSLGVALDFTDLDKIAGPGQCGRPHIAKLLVEQKIVRTMDEAFKKYLGQGGQAYESRFIYGAEEAINIIKNAGGLAVLAHPLQLCDIEEMPNKLRDLTSMGLDGIEVYYPTHSKKNRKKLMLFAEKYQMVITGGSDFHGSIRPGTSLAGGRNVSVPSHLLDKMKQRVADNCKTDKN